MSNWS